MLDINGTLILQIANFLVLLLLMNVILYRPIRRMLSQRAEEMAGRESSIEALKEKAGRYQEDIEEGMVAARKEGYNKKEALKAEGLAEEKGFLQEASASVEQKMSAARKDMENKTAEVRKALEEQIADFSNELAEKILGRSVR
ncbi:MAG: ATP synthase F0 subunit B [Deltaproteobacteria bacterium]|jgi:F-type H+-transporting ATPase subunit b